jgi:hypothetical protein
MIASVKYSTVFVLRCLGDEILGSLDVVQYSIIR